MHLTTKQKWEIIFLSKHRRGPHFNNTQIAKELKTDVKTIRFWIDKYEKTGDVEGEKTTGRPRVTTPQEDKKIISLHQQKPKLSTPQLQRELKKRKIEVGQHIIKRRLHEAGIKFISPIRKPLLTKTHIERRLKWAFENQSTDWNNVIFTDETTIQIGYNKKKFWQDPRERLVIRTVKHPLKVHVWGCFSRKGFGKIIIFQKNLNSQFLLNIYENALLPSSKILMGDKWLLQEDNDPKHTSKIAQQWREENNVKKIDWPSQSPDQNPIEHVWRIIKCNVAEHDPRSLKELVKYIRYEWKKLPLSLAENLVDSMSNRIHALIDSQGDYTMY